MMSGAIRAEVGVDDPGACPVARASRNGDGLIPRVSRASGTTDDGVVAEEFVGETGISRDDPEVEPIFEHEDGTVYRFEREPGWGCVCEYIESYGCPVSNLHAEDGTLYASFIAADLEVIQEIISGLQTKWGGIRVRQLTDADAGSGEECVFVDRSRLTARQREVLAKSYDMGYFEHPKRANAGEVADALGISASTFSEHLAAAQGKLLGMILEA